MAMQEELFSILNLFTLVEIFLSELNSNPFFFFSGEYHFFRFPIYRCHDFVEKVMYPT
jgi:hypothetical protein